MYSFFLLFYVPGTVHVCGVDAFSPILLMAVTVNVYTEFSTKFLSIALVPKILDVFKTCWLSKRL